MRGNEQNIKFTAFTPDLSEAPKMWLVGQFRASNERIQMRS